MRKIKAVPVTKENFAPFGRYFNFFDIPARESEDFTAYTSIAELTDEPMNLGITVCRGADQFKPVFCGDGEMVLTVADSDPDRYPEAGDVKAFIMKPGDVVVLAKGIWHDANHGTKEGHDVLYYFMATNKEPDNFREIEWVKISPEPVLVETGGDKSGK